MNPSAATPPDPRAVRDPKTVRSDLRGPTTGWAAALPCALLAGLLGCAPNPGPGSSDCQPGGPCRDSDCDRICDRDEGYPGRDTDRDGTPDYLDLDSDNDGLTDRTEAGDGNPLTRPIDTDGNGVADYREPFNAARQPDANSQTGDAGPTGRDANGLNPPPHDGGTLAMTQNDAAVHPTPAPGPRCMAPEFVEHRCGSETDSPCNGDDDDCDGKIDERLGCQCIPGSIRACYPGPSTQRTVGACHTGTQRCDEQEFPSWGPCKGSRTPEPEHCDGLDNDCNGCADDLDACVPVLACPQLDDVRLPTAKPHHPYTLHAADFYSGADATGFSWEVSGSPCDQLFAQQDPSATADSGQLSFRVASAKGADPEFQFSLSGTYDVTFTVYTPRGPQQCQFTIPVQAPGLRVELCWDKTGPPAAAAMDRVDLDLHLGKAGTTAAWNGPGDCFWGTCKGATSPWGYGQTALEQCKGSQNSATYENPLVAGCPNPRLDADNRLDRASALAYLTENISVDAPLAGDSYRVAVSYNTNEATSSDTVVAVPVRPLVNVYCGGTRVATFTPEPSALAGFDLPGAHWRIADVLLSEGGPLAGCTVQPLRTEQGALVIEATTPESY